WGRGRRVGRHRRRRGVRRVASARKGLTTPPPTRPSPNGGIALCRRPAGTNGPFERPSPGKSVSASRMTRSGPQGGFSMFFHRQEVQYKATPDKPDAVYARKLQEVLGGQYGEITVAMQYMFQGWNMHIPGKYRDLVFGIGAEEFGHVEMLATMIA